MRIIISFYLALAVVPVFTVVAELQHATYVTLDGGLKLPRPSSTI